MTYKNIVTSRTITAATFDKIARELDGVRELEVSFDAEWIGDPGVAPPIENNLTLQFTFDLGNRYVANYPMMLKLGSAAELGEAARKAGGESLFIPNDYPLLCEILDRAPDVRSVMLRWFFSPKDPSCMIGRPLFESMVYPDSKSGGKPQSLVQAKRRHTFGKPGKQPGLFLNVDRREVNYHKRGWAKDDRIVSLLADDVSGNAPNSLENFCKITSTPMAKSEVAHEEKRRLDLVVKTDPERFYRYGFGDIHLKEARLNFDNLARQVGLEVGVSADKLKRIPGTNGSLVAKMLELWVFQSDPLVPYAVTRLGELKALGDAKKMQASREIFHTVNDEFRRDYEAARLVVTETEPEGVFKDYLKPSKLPMDTYGHSEGGIAALGRKEGYLATAAICQGGRCINEWVKGPGERGVLHNVLDIDQDSCYGSGLKHFTYPLGLPTVIGAHSNDRDEDVLTLGEFLNEYESDLVPGLWQVHVSGSLNFRQDLVLSKLVKPDDIRRAVGRIAEGESPKDVAEYGDREDDISHVPGDFGLFQREIANGVITGEILNTIRAVSTNKELRGWMRLKVQSAAFYRASDRVGSPEDFSRVVMTSEGELGLDGDGRTRAWVGLPLSGFIGKLVEVRGFHKKRKGGRAADGSELSPDEQAFSAAYQEFLKLVINTTYGVEASPFFKVSNVVVANNITAKARDMCWWMAKSLGGATSITDGCPYEAHNVRFMADWAKNPGFDRLAVASEWEDTRKGLRVGPLGGLDWTGLEILREWAEKDGIDAAHKRVDVLAVTHMRAFLGRYGVEYKVNPVGQSELSGVNFEHKQHSCLRMVIQGKSDYAGTMLDLWGKEPNPARIGEYEVDRNLILIKLRGDKSRYDDSRTHSNKFIAIIAELCGAEVYPPLRPYIRTKIQKVNNWRMQRHANSEGLVPMGESYEQWGDADSTRTIKGLEGPMMTPADFKRKNESRRGLAFGKYLPTEPIQGVKERIYADKI